MASNFRNFPEREKYFPPPRHRFVNCGGGKFAGEIRLLFPLFRCHSRAGGNPKCKELARCLTFAFVVGILDSRLRGNDGMEGRRKFGGKVGGGITVGGKITAAADGIWRRWGELRRVGGGKFADEIRLLFPLFRCHSRAGGNPKCKELARCLTFAFVVGILDSRLRGNDGMEGRRKFGGRVCGGNYGGRKNYGGGGGNWRRWRGITTGRRRQICGQIYRPFQFLRCHSREGGNPKCKEWRGV